ncbi:NAD-dependent epimerase/dehydratase family protein [Nonomuraea sp. K274]|uniref:NAD-dependent epimerase/dehydratase family protein n=1 Tax=Nonomuraea cypriaca TaxID=1187855 RepID=A0A931A6X3_9ACTN|nr:NAD-dependent epimerase/dehydratase family protein [Nonomuraea cypriaca]MBF8187466.1 NAD-dependent epimerase/dehydratase family protein [Nonomuraea cypriaca]
MTRILVLGGTAFVGRAVIASALERGWDVTAFNRGISGSPPEGTKTVHGDRNNSADIAKLATAGPWDAVVDTSGYVPRNVLATAQALEPVVNRYVFMSTVSVYADWPVKPLTESSTVLECPPDADENFGEDVEDGPTKYGYQKSGCELAAQITVGRDRTTVLRPGVVLGPHEYVGRLPWWLRRVSDGGRVLSPGTPSRSIQPVDVRDLANFAVRAIEHSLPGVFNVTAPIGFDTFGGLLANCASVTQSDAEFVWARDEVLLAAGVRQWSEMPLWRVHAGVWQVSSDLAHARGLECRPLVNTVRDTWEWLKATNNLSTHERSNEIGISKTRENEILAALT